MEYHQQGFWPGGRWKRRGRAARTGRWPERQWGSRWKCQGGVGTAICWLTLPPPGIRGTVDFHFFLMSATDIEQTSWGKTATAGTQHKPNDPHNHHYNTSFIKIWAFIVHPFEWLFFFKLLSISPWRKTFKIKEILLLHCGDLHGTKHLFLTCSLTVVNVSSGFIVCSICISRVKLDTVWESLEDKHIFCLTLTGQIAFLCYQTEI